MLRITIPETEYFDHEKEEFIKVEEVVLELEHSLVSLSKWESKWKKPFLEDSERTDAQTIDYVRMMSVSGEISDETLYRLTQAHIDQVGEYLNDSMTATWFNEPKKTSGRKEVITAEIIYYWMISLTIPFECQYWHLNRLLTLIKVCNHKNDPGKSKKMSKSELASRNRALNEQRRAQMKTSG